MQGAPKVPQKANTFYGYCGWGKTEGGVHHPGETGVVHTGSLRHRVGLAVELGVKEAGNVGRRWCQRNWNMVLYKFKNVLLDFVIVCCYTCILYLMTLVNSIISSNSLQIFAQMDIASANNDNFCLTFQAIAFIYLFSLLH